VDGGGRVYGDPISSEAGRGTTDQQRAKHSTENRLRNEEAEEEE
jgi:hypothetical protein